MTPLLNSETTTTPTAGWGSNPLAGYEFASDAGSNTTIPIKENQMPNHFTRRTLLQTLVSGLCGLLCCRTPAAQ